VYAGMRPARAGGGCNLLLSALKCALLRWAPVTTASHGLLCGLTAHQSSPVLPHSTRRESPPRAVKNYLDRVVGLIDILGLGSH